MNFNQLRYFITVADNHSFTEAASKLFVSQPTLSHGISSLEADLDTQLFIRERHSIKLSPSGEKLYEIASEILHLVDKAYTEIKPAINYDANILRIGMMGDLLPMLFPSTISPFLMEHAEVKCLLEQMTVVKLHEALKLGQLDCIITRGASLNDIPVPNSELIVLQEDEFCLVVPNDHPLAKVKKLSDLSILKGENFLALNPEKTSPLVDKLMQICQARNYTPNAATSDVSLDAVLAKVSSGSGITITPKSYIYFKKYPKVTRIDLGNDPDLKNDIVIAFLKSNNNPSLETFTDYLKTIDKKNFEEIDQ